jgi:5-methylcytosine-specific restriction endonuclease McrA
VWQLDVDHWDGNKKNIDPSNFVTFCANCHRYKTFLFGDNIKRVKSKPISNNSDISEKDDQT